MRRVELEGIEGRTAESLTTLARLRGVSAIVVWNGKEYLANGVPCGPSVHGVNEWIAKAGGKP